MAVLRDNVRSVRIGEMEIDLEASLGTGIVYANEFRGRLEAPYKGILADDMLAVWHRNQPTDSEDGNEVENPDYTGIDVEALLRIAWAMARAVDPEQGRPYRKGYRAFHDEAIHQPTSIFDEAALYDAVILRLGNGITFRRPEGLSGAVEPDEAQEEAEG